MSVDQETLDRHVAQDEVAARRIAEARRVGASVRKEVASVVILVSFGVFGLNQVGVYSFAGIWLFIAWVALFLCALVWAQTDLALSPQGHIADYASRPVAVTCPVCKAPPGERCATGLPSIQRRARGSLHGDRWHVYRAAREAMGHPTL